VSRGESNEYRPDDQSQPSEDDLFSQPLDFDDLADDSPVGEPAASGGPSESGPASDIFSFESEPTAAGEHVEPKEAGDSGAFLFESDESAQPASAELSGGAESSGEAEMSSDAKGQSLPDHWQPQGADEGELIASSSEEPSGAAESGQMLESEPEFAAADQADAAAGEQETPVFADQEQEAAAFTDQEAESGAAAEEGAETGVPGELPAGLLGIGGDEQAKAEESAETAEQPEEEEEEKEKKPSLLHRLAEASPYTVMLGLSCLAILLACIFLMIELWRYDFDIGAKSGKKVSQAGVAAQWTAPAETFFPRMLG